MRILCRRQKKIRNKIKDKYAIQAIRIEKKKQHAVLKRTKNKTEKKHFEGNLFLYVLK